MRIESLVPLRSVFFLAVLAAMFVAAPSHAQDSAVVQRIAQYGNMPVDDARAIVETIDATLFANSNRQDGQYDRIRKRVAKSMFRNPGRSRAEYNAKLQQVMGRLRNGVDPKLMTVLFPRGKETVLQCVYDFPLTMAACDAIQSAVTGQASMLPYTKPDSGANLRTALHNAGVSNKRAKGIALALHRTMLGVPRNLSNQATGRDLAALMKSCPGALRSQEAQIRAWHVGPTEGMARCIAKTLSRRGTMAVPFAQGLLGMGPHAAGAFMAWGNPGSGFAPELAGVGVDKVLETARAHYRAKRYTKAADAYSQATRMDPANWRAFAGLGSAKLYAGEPGEAIAAYNTALRLNPRNPNLHAMIAEAQTEDGAYDQAMGSYRQALALAPNHKRAKKGLATLERTKNLAAAKKWRAKGKLHLRARQKKIALKAYSKAIKAEPTHPEGHAGLAETQIALKKYDLAVASYETAIGLDPNNAQYWTRLGFAQQQAGDDRKAVASLKRALVISPNMKTAKRGLKALAKASAKTSEPVEPAEPVVQDDLVASLLDDPLKDMSESERSAGLKSKAEQDAERKRREAEAAAAAKVAVEAKPTPAAPAPTEEDDIVASLLAEEPKPAAAKEKPVVAPVASGESDSDDGKNGDIPEVPSRDDILKTMVPLKGKLQKCMPKVHGKLVFGLTIAGSNGAVVDATFKKGPPVAKDNECMVKVLKSARLPKFKKSEINIAFPYKL